MQVPSLNQTVKTKVPHTVNELRQFLALMNFNIGFEPIPEGKQEKRQNEDTVERLITLDVRRLQDRYP